MNKVKKIATAITATLLLSVMACSPRGGTNSNADMNQGPEYQHGNTDSNSISNPGNPANEPADTFNNADSIPNNMNTR
ncbi:MAG TPA: hypothetical protein VFL76_10590 [Edaphocola sp.]|nr:hypothetical protein [Edaphocola sp.]